MHLQLTKARWKNLLSTGNSFTEVQLDKSPHTLIVGINGAGKSTFIEAVCFGLFNKSFRRINKPQLINSINQKHLVVEIEFKVNSKEYLIRRGMKPNIFEIYRSGELLNQASDNRDYQSYLEKNIIKMNFKTFTQIVVLGSSNYVPFMQMPAMGRREIIEDLLDIEDFSKMNLILKDKINNNKNTISENDNKIILISEKITLTKAHQSEIKQDRVKAVAETKQKILDSEVAIAEDEAAVAKLMSQVSELQNKVSDEKKVSKQRVELNTVRASLISKLGRLDEESKFFHDINNCPTCNQEINDKLRCDVVTKKTSQQEEIKDAIIKLNDMETENGKRLEEIEKINSDIKQLNTQIFTLNSNSSIQKAMIRAYTAEIKKLELIKDETSTNNLREMQKDLKVLESNKTDLTEDRQTFELAATLLKDSGIKANIIKKYVPVMNKLINKYLAAMEFFVNFELDENFNEVIKSRFRDEFTYHSFSEGERMRLNLALLFAWRAIAKLKNSASCNLLLLDEVMDSSMDAAGTDDFLKIIYELTADTNTFIISHKVDQMVDKFSEVIRFQKHGNFSVRE